MAEGQSGQLKSSIARDFWRYEASLDEMAAKAARPGAMPEGRFAGAGGSGLNAQAASCTASSSATDALIPTAARRAASSAGP